MQSYKRGKVVFLFTGVAIIKCHRLCGFKTEIYFLTIPEARRPRWSQQNWYLPRRLSLACGWPPPHCAFTWSPLCECVCLVSLSVSILISSSYSDTSRIEVGPTLMTLFLLHVFKDLFSVCSHILRYWA